MLEPHLQQYLSNPKKHVLQLVQLLVIEDLRGKLIIFASCALYSDLLFYGGLHNLMKDVSRRLPSVLNGTSYSRTRLNRVAPKTFTLLYLLSKQSVHGNNEHGTPFRAVPVFRGNKTTWSNLEIVLCDHFFSLRNSAVFSQKFGIRHEYGALQLHKHVDSQYQCWFQKKNWRT